MEVILGRLCEGFLLNFKLFGLTLLFALPLGLVIAFGSMSRFKPLAWLVKVFVWVIRGTPLMLQLLIIFLGPGLMGMGNPWPSGPDGRLTAATVAFVPSPADSPSLPPAGDNAFLELFDLFAVRVIDFNWNFDGIAKVILEIRYLRERWRSESIIGCHHCKNLVCTRRERLFTLIMVVFMFLAICRIYCFYDKGIVSLVFMFYDWLSEPRFVTYNDFVFF